ncbi:MAG: tryptophan--tRNA ligase, partial [Clostridiales bacterium]|nr:tryptophan--tRNA ligase [Clostridiales bacterium]
PKVGARIMSLTSPENKMSKSDHDAGGCIYLMQKPEEIMRLFKRAVTDSDSCVRYDVSEKPGVSNLMQIYSAATGSSFESIENEFSGRGYGDFKLKVGESVVELLRPIREEAERLLADKVYLEETYKNGADRASLTAEHTIRKVYKKLGFIAK